MEDGLLSYQMPTLDASEKALVQSLQIDEELRIRTTCSDFTLANRIWRIARKARLISGEYSEARVQQDTVCVITAVLQGDLKVVRFAWLVTPPTFTPRFPDDDEELLTQIKTHIVAQLMA